MFDIIDTQEKLENVRLQIHKEFLIKHPDREFEILLRKNADSYLESVAIATDGKGRFL